MPWNGSGTFSRTNGTYSGATVWQQDEAASVGIEASRADTHDEDIATAINNTLARDGQNSPSAHLSYLNTQGIASSSTGSSGAYAVTLSPAPSAYYTNMRVTFTSNHACTSGATLNVNSLGAKAIVTVAGDAIPDSGIASGQLVEVVYNGTSFVLLSGLSAEPITFSANPTGSGSLSWSSTTTHIAQYAVDSWPQVHLAVRIAGTLSSGGLSSSYLTIDLPIAPATAEHNNSLPCSLYFSSDALEISGAAIIRSSNTLDIYRYDGDELPNTGTGEIKIHGFYYAA